MATAVLAAVALLSPAEAAGQIHIGSAELEIGQDTAVAMPVLRRWYRLSCSEGGALDETCLLLSKQGPPYESYGSVGIYNGRVALVGKDWAPSDRRDGFEVISSLVDALSSLAQSSESRCTIEPAGDAQPRVDIRRVKIRCGFHSIAIVAFRSPAYGDGITITEFWSLLSTWP